MNYWYGVVIVESYKVVVTKNGYNNRHGVFKSIFSPIHRNSSVVLPIIL